MTGDREQPLLRENHAAVKPLATGTVRPVHIDALRGIAVFGILLVNVWAFVWGFENLRYGVLTEPAAWPDRLAVFLTGFFAEKKF